MVIPDLIVACDWFIGHWQIRLSPEDSRKQLLEVLPVAEEVLGESTLPPLDVILDASLLIAQGIHYLDEPIECCGVLKIAVDSFLSIPPENPSVENCVLLVNLLMATYSEKRTRLVHEGDFFTWEVYQPAADNDTYGFHGGAP